MDELNKADWKMTTSLPELRICWSGSWGGSWGESSNDGRRNIGYFGMWSVDSIMAVKEQFEDARKRLAVCIKETENENGKKYLSFLDNRLRTTIIYMKAMQKGAELQPLFLEKSLRNLLKRIGILLLNYVMSRWLCWISALMCFRKPCPIRMPGDIDKLLLYTQSVFARVKRKIWTYSSERYNTEGYKN